MRNFLFIENRAKCEKGYDKEQIDGKVLSVTKCDFNAQVKNIPVE